MNLWKEKDNPYRWGGKDQNFLSSVPGANVPDRKAERQAYNLGSPNITHKNVLFPLPMLISSHFTLPLCQESLGYIDFNNNAKFSSIHIYQVLW